MRAKKIAWDVFSVNASVVLVVLAMAGVGWGSLEARDFTGPDCIPPETWSWMDNAQSMNPCRTAAYLQGACRGTTFQVSVLNNTHYDPGNATTADNCYCSWATYNLLSACTLCQNEQNGILSWAAWNSSDCAKFTSTTSPWPGQFNDSIPNNVTFPNWAAKDPRTWTDGRWNAAQATQIAKTEFGDYPLESSAPTQSAKSGGTNAGAIAGGVVGGVVAIAIGVAVAVLLVCRAKRRRAELEKKSDPDITHTEMNYHHAPSPSDGSTRFYGASSGYTPLGHVSSPSNGSMFLPSPSTFVTHASDQQSLAHESLLHSFSMAPSPGPQGSSTVFVAPQPQGTVSPFVGQQPTASANSHSKKMSEASQGGSIMNEIPARTPLNPPAYSEAPGDRGDFSSQHPDQMSTVGSSSFVTTPSSSAQQTRHEKSASATSMTSTGSHLMHTSNTGYWNQLGSTSLSGAAGMLNDNDTPSTSIPTPSYTAPPPGAIMSVTRSEKQRPTPPAADTAQTDGNDVDG